MLRDLFDKKEVKIEAQNHITINDLINDLDNHLTPICVKSDFIKDNIVYLEKNHFRIKEEAWQIQVSLNQKAYKFLSDKKYKIETKNLGNITSNTKTIEDSKLNSLLEYNLSFYNELSSEDKTFILNNLKYEFNYLNGKIKKLKEANYRLIAEIDKTKENELIKLLEKNNAVYTDNYLDMDVPEHHWRPGKQFSLGKRYIYFNDLGSINYVPYNNKNNQNYQNRHNMTFSLSSKVLNEKLEEFINSRLLDDNEIILCRRFLVNEDNSVGDEITHRIYPLRKFSAKRREIIKEYLESGNDNYHKYENYKEEIFYYKYQVASKEEIKYCKQYKVINKQFIYKKDYYAIEKLKETIQQYIKYEENNGIAYAHAIQFIHESENKLDKSQYKDFVTSYNKSAGFNWALSRIVSNLEPTNYTVQQIAKPMYEMVADTPPSEKGVLSVLLMHPFRAFETLMELGVIDNYYKKYNNKHPKGRIKFYLEDYIKADNKAILPDNKMLIHGMTGVNNPKEAQERLELIIKYKGLLSYKERRRLGLKVKSADPHSDTASGLDCGVPTCLTNNPWTGKYILFGIHPRALARRDLWLHYTCPVGSGNQQRIKYLQYAQQLGQTDLYDPPSAKARWSHFYETTLNEYNEVYFRHSVDIEDFDCLFVSKENDFHKTIEKLIEEYKSQGLVHHNLKVIGFTPSDHHMPSQGLPGLMNCKSLTTAISKRAKDICDEYKNKELDLEHNHYPLDDEYLEALSSINSEIKSIDKISNNHFNNKADKNSEGTITTKNIKTSKENIVKEAELLKNKQLETNKKLKELKNKFINQNTEKKAENTELTEKGNQQLNDLMKNNFNDISNPYIYDNIKEKNPVKKPNPVKKAKDNKHYKILDQMRENYYHSENNYTYNEYQDHPKEEFNEKEFLDLLDNIFPEDKNK